MLSNIKPFEINIGSLLSKRFSSTKTDINHYKRENYDSIAEHCAPDVVAASGINGIGNACNKTIAIQFIWCEQ